MLKMEQKINFTCLVIQMQMFLIHGDVKSFDFTKVLNSIKFSIFLYCFTCENHNVLRVNRSVCIHQL